MEEAKLPGTDRWGNQVWPLGYATESAAPEGVTGGFGRGPAQAPFVKAEAAEGGPVACDRSLAQMGARRPDHPATGATSGTTAESVIARSKLKHAAAYDKWEKHDDALLLVMYAQGQRLSEIAAHFNRTRGAIQSRLRKLTVQCGLCGRDGASCSCDFGV